MCCFVESCRLAELHQCRSSGVGTAGSDIAIVKIPVSRACAKLCSDVLLLVWCRETLLLKKKAVS